MDNKKKKKKKRDNLDNQRKQLIIYEKIWRKGCMLTSMVKKGIYIYIYIKRTAI